MPNTPGNDLLLLLMSLAQVENAALVKRMFCEALESIWKNCRFSLQDSACQDKTLESGQSSQCQLVLASRDRHFGWICVEGDKESVELANGPTLQNAIAILALILENLAMRDSLKEQVQERTAALDSFFEVSENLFCIADTHGHFLRVNQAWQTTLGYTVAELAGQKFLDLVHPDDIQATLATMQTLNQQHSIPSFVNRYRHKDGSFRHIEWRSTPKGHLIFAVARDVTEQRLAQQERDRLYKELKHKNEELERFNYAVSHDLRSPIITIQGFARELEMDLNLPENDEKHVLLRQIISAANHMGNMLRDILHLSRLTSAEQVKSPVSLSKVIEEVIQINSAIIQSTQTTIKVSPEMPTLMGYRTPLFELFQNLILNSIKYRKSENNAIIQIASQTQEDHVEITVTDNGIGIAPLHQANIFGLFQKINKNSEGMGIGLTIVKRAVELHGGSIRVHSQGLGMGTTFTMQFGLDGL